jgi:EAL domain-containing protein (putative c-di-GMP-specific phosphodiesterase class I)
MRWNHPERGLVPAAEFIRLAEDTGLIVPVGEWALREAARQIRSWADEGRLTRPVSVNLSASQFREHGLVERVRRILVETGVEPSLLEVEISEATLMQQTDQTVARLDALQSLGLRLSIDHVGARHGALAYLSRFPVNRIAIDRAVVARLPGDDASEQIVRSVVAFARGLKLRVAAEGVETAAQLDWLKASGCDEVQGYHLAAPVPAETLLSSAGLDSRSLGGASR